MTLVASRSPHAYRSFVDGVVLAYDAEPTEPFVAPTDAPLRTRPRNSVEQLVGLMHRRLQQSGLESGVYPLLHSCLQASPGLPEGSALKAASALSSAVVYRPLPGLPQSLALVCTSQTAGLAAWVPRYAP